MIKGHNMAWLEEQVDSGILEAVIRLTDEQDVVTGYVARAVGCGDLHHILPCYGASGTEYIGSLLIICKGDSCDDEAVLLGSPEARDALIQHVLVCKCTTSPTEMIDLTVEDDVVVPTSDDE